VPDRVEQARDQLGVVRRARDQLARADAVVVARVQLERPPEDLVADGGVRLRAVPDREVVAGAAGGRLDGSEQDDRPAGPPEDRLVAAGDPGVDRLAHEQRRRQGGSLPRQPRDDCPDDRPPKPARDRTQVAPTSIHTAKLLT